MKELRLAASESVWEELCGSLDHDEETSGVILAGLADGPDRLTLCLNSIIWSKESSYEERSARHLKLRSEAWMPALGEAADGGWQPLFFHTHPGASPLPSRQDRGVEASLAPTFSTRLGRPYASLIIGGSSGSPSFTATFDGRGIDLLRVVGDRIRLLSAADRSPENEPLADHFDRQIRAFGSDGQRYLRRLRVGVVGAGGTGSAVAEQLLRLGVGSITVVDDDHLSDTNLTRIHESSRLQVKLPKVQLVESAAERIDLGTEVRAIEGKVTEMDAVRSLVDCDAVFGCTDDNAGRAVLSRFAYYYLVPVFDLGVLIRSAEGAITAIEARLTVMTPGQPCLFCRDRIDPVRMREETQDPAELEGLRGEGYARGLGEPDPAVVSYTTMIASIGVDEMLQRLFGYGDQPPAGETLLQIPPRRFRRLAGSPIPGHFCERSDIHGRADCLPPLGRTWA
jgi:molybdopterin/thiamine biosynthesis adenylyltransferase